MRHNIFLTAWSKNNCKNRKPAAGSDRKCCQHGLTLAACRTKKKVIAIKQGLVRGRGAAGTAGIGAVVFGHDKVLNTAALQNKQLENSQ